jgi:hypothetical protein
MNGIIKQVLNDKIIKSGMTISGSIILLETVLVIFFYFSLPPLMPIFNQLPWGEARLGSKLTFFIPLLITLFFFALNFFMITKIHEQTPLLSRILSITTLLVSILSIIFTIRTLQLII